jgi:hypothetical protein
MALEPIGASRQQIQKFAESIRQGVGYEQGDNLDGVIHRLGGDLLYVGVDHREGPSITVRGPRSFEIKVFVHSRLEQARVSLAHELGHYFLHSQSGQKPLEAPFFGEGQVEVEANWFAYAFLMPEEEFRAKWPDGIDRVQTYFWVSRAVIEARAAQLGLMQPVRN